jgi:hypothetical protein
MRLQAAMLAGFMVFWSGASAAQIAGTQASATAGALCCTVQASADVQGSPHPTTGPTFSAAASFASQGVGIAHPVLANASAYADLTTGEIGAAGFSTDYGYTLASAGFRDVLSFFVPGATATTVTPITINLLYHGTIEPGYGGVNTQFIFSTLQFLFNGGSNQTAIVVNRDKGTGNDQQNFYSRVQDSGWLEFSATPNAAADTYAIKAVLGAYGANPVVSINQSLGLTTSQAANADFSHTASLRLDMPSGVTYTSASGLFLSQMAAVPETTTWMMMIVGFGAIGAAARRSKPRDREALASARILRYASSGSR